MIIVELNYRLKRIYIIYLFDGDIWFGSTVTKMRNNKTTGTRVDCLHPATVKSLSLLLPLLSILSGVSVCRSQSDLDSDRNMTNFFNFY